jgi:hypothetical protein
MVLISYYPKFNLTCYICSSDHVNRSEIKQFRAIVTFLVLIKQFFLETVSYLEGLLSHEILGAHIQWR